jgi:hypothetical protein
MGCLLFLIRLRLESDSFGPEKDGRITKAIRPVKNFEEGPGLPKRRKGISLFLSPPRALF